MAIDRIRLVAALAGAACLTGCASGQAGMGWGKQDNFGEASRQTFAAQVINPNPVYDEPYAVGNGAKAAAAVERYRTDKIKQPMVQRISTTGAAASSSRGN